MVCHQEFFNLKFGLPNILIINVTVSSNDCNHGCWVRASNTRLLRVNRPRAKRSMGVGAGTHIQWSHDQQDYSIDVPVYLYFKHLLPLVHSFITIEIIHFSQALPYILGII